MHHPTAETSVRKYYLGVLIIWSALSVVPEELFRLTHLHRLRYAFFACAAFFRLSHVSAFSWF